MIRPDREYGTEAEYAFDVGELGPLIDCVRSGSPLTEGEREIIAQILEAVDTGKGWRPPKKPRKPEWAKRIEGRRVLDFYNSRLAMGHPDKVAIEQAAAKFRISVRTARSRLADARKVPPAFKRWGPKR